MSRKDQIRAAMDKHEKPIAKTAKPTRREMIESKMKDMWCLLKKKSNQKTHCCNRTKNQPLKSKKLNELLVEKC